MDTCADCEKLWDAFAAANQQLLKLVEQKFDPAKEPRDRAALEAEIQQTIRFRQAARQRVLEHQKQAHP